MEAGRGTGPEVDGRNDFTRIIREPVERGYDRTRWIARPRWCGCATNCEGSWAGDQEKIRTVFNVCPRCGEYSEKKTIDPDGPFAICPSCGHRHRFMRLPLFVITGASGVGKTTIALNLASSFQGCITLDSDILWGAVATAADDHYRTYRNTWLRLVKNIGQAGRPVALVGTALPEQFEECSERRYFAQIHYLALVCDDAALAERLRARPAWRASGGEDVVEAMLRFNAYLKANSSTTSPPMSRLDTTYVSVDESAAATMAWIRERLP